jgi:hypothetical protein
MKPTLEELRSLLDTVERFHAPEPWTVAHKEYARHLRLAIRQYEARDERELTNLVEGIRYMLDLEIT